MNVIRHPRHRTLNAFSTTLDSTRSTVKRESRHERNERIPPFLDRRVPRRDEEDVDGVAVLGDK